MLPTRVQVGHWPMIRGHVTSGRLAYVALASAPVGPAHAPAVARPGLADAHRAGWLLARVLATGARYVGCAPADHASRSFAGRGGQPGRGERIAVPFAVAIDLDADGPAAPAASPALRRILPR